MTRPAWTVAALLAVVPAGRGADDALDSVMDRDPALPAARVVTVFPERLRTLWLDALARPEAEFRCQAALAVGTAHKQGMTGLEAAVPPLLAALDGPDQPPAVRLAAARALIELDARESAPALLRQAQSGEPGMRELVEPALAKWDHPPARAVWLDRVQRPDAARGDLLVAIRCLAAVREEKAIPGLQALAVGRDTPAPTRLAAARALGELRTAGSEADARKLASTDVVGRLSAAALLQRHTGVEAVDLLKALGRDANPAVAAAALARLVEIDPGLVVPECGRLLAGPDARLRSLAVEALSRTPSEENVRLLGGRLDDPHPEVRTSARRGLRAAADKPPLRDSVSSEGMRALAAPGWRGQEQAAILLAQIGHAPAATRLVELLPAARPEVGVAAAWGLRQLNVPETLPAVTAFLGSPRWDRPAAADADARQLSQLAQFVGQAEYRPAEPTLRRFVPRGRGPAGAWPEARAAAIWALGRIHAGSAPSDLAEALEDRLGDDPPTGNPEHPRVRRMAAVALGRMKATAALGTLRTYRSRGPSREPLPFACDWAIGQITGDAPPPVGAVEVPARDWFLVPLESGRK